MSDEEKDLNDVPEEDASVEEPSSATPESEETAEESPAATPVVEESPVEPSKQETSSAVSEAAAAASLIEEDRSGEALNNLGRILDIKLELVVQIGTLDMKLKDVLDLYPGSILEIEKNADAPLELTIGPKKLAKGEVVTVGENLGLRIIKKA